MSKWIKGSKYYDTNGNYTMAWGDVGRFQLYYGDKYIESGTREECLLSFKNHNKAKTQEADNNERD